MLVVGGAGGRGGGMCVGDRKALKSQAQEVLGRRGRDVAWARRPCAGGAESFYPGQGQVAKAAGTTPGS